VVESGIGWQGEGVAEKEVARGRSSRGLMMVSFCSIVCSLVAGSSALRGRWLASLHTSAKRDAGEGSWGQQRPCSQPIGCTTTPANILRAVACIRYGNYLSNGKYIEVIEDTNNYWCSSVTSPHSLTNKDGRRKEKARAFRSGLVSSLRLIPFQTKVGRLISPISSPHSTLACLRS